MSVKAIIINLIVVGVIGTPLCVDNDLLAHCGVNSDLLAPTVVSIVTYWHTVVSMILMKCVY